jgi:C-terminal processing protease CtpA/Prc
MPQELEVPQAGGTSPASSTFNKYRSGGVMFAKKQFSTAAILAFLLIAALIVSCSPEVSGSSEEDRRALVDYLIEKTMEREAFSPVKNERLNLDVESAMRAYEDEVVAAKSDEELFYALAKLSNARHDRHLSVWPIEGGIAAPEDYPDNGPDAPVAPIRIDVDYSSSDDLILFVSDIAAGESDPGGVQAGDKILAVNGVSVKERYEQTRPYYRYSTEHGYRKKFSQGFNSRTGL